MYTHYYRDAVKLALARRQRILHTVTLLGTPLLFLAVVIVGGIVAPHSYAASYTWDGGGADNNWSTCANWSSDICPVAGDSVTFNGTSTKDSTVDASWGGSLTGLTIASGYTGTITMARSLTMSGAYSQATGTFTAGANNLIVGSNFALSGGAFNASSATTQVNAGFSVTGSPTFNANGGTFAFGGTSGGNVSLACNGITFNLVTFTNTIAYKSIGAGCSLPLGANPTAYALTLNGGSISGSGTLTVTSGLGMTLGTNPMSGFTGLVTGVLTINGASMDFGGYTTLDINDVFTLSSGVFTAPTGVATFAKAFTISGGTFNANGGTVTFDSTSGGTLSCNNAVFNTVVLAQTSNSKTVSSNCSLPIGNNPTIGPVSLTGSLVGTGTLNASTLALNSGSTLSGFSGLVVGGAFTSNATYDFSAYTLVDFNSSFALNSGAVFTAPSGTITAAGSFTINTGTTFNANGGIVTFDGNANSTFTITCNNAVFSQVVFAHTVGSRTVNAGCSLPLGNNPTMTGSVSLSGELTGSGTLSSNATLTLGTTYSLSGFNGLVVGSTLTINSASADFGAYTTFDTNGAFVLNTGAVFTAPTGTASFAGSFTLNTGSTFNANGGTVVFDGSGGTLSCNNTVFNFVRITATSGAKLVSANCNLPLGNNPILPPGGGITLNGTLTGTGTYTMGPTGGATDFTINSTGQLSGFTGLVVARDLKLVGAALDASNFTSFVVKGGFRMSSGATLIAPTATANFATGFTIDPGTFFNANSGTVVFDGSSSTLSCNNTAFNLVKFDHSSTSTKVVNSDCSLPLGNNPTFRGSISLNGTLSGSGLLTTNTFSMSATGALSGFNGLKTTGSFVSSATNNDFSNYSSVAVGNAFTLNAGSFTAPPSMSVIGNFSNLGGTFNANDGTVSLTGVNQTVSGNNTFYNLTKQTAGILTFGAGSTTTVLGKLTLSGSAGTLSLVSATPGSVWNIDMQGTTNICSVSVTDSNSIGNAVVAYQSTSNSANPGWVFLNDACPGSGGGGGGGGTGGEPVSTVTNYTNAQAAATAAGITTTTPNTSLPPYYGLPSTLSKTIDTVPGSREALKAFLRFVVITAFVMLLAGGIAWFVAGKRRKDQEDDTLDSNHLPSSWNHTRVG